VNVDSDGANQGLRPLFIAVLVVGLLASLGVYQVWHQHRVIELGRELSEASSRYTELTELQRKLRLELATGKRIDAIRDHARENFGMKIPERGDYIVVTR